MKPQLMTRIMRKKEMEENGGKYSADIQGRALVPSDVVVIVVEMRNYSLDFIASRTQFR